MRPLQRRYRQISLLFDGEHLKIYALGKLSTEQLNEKVAHLFQQLLNDNFGINTQVTFLNDEEVYSKAAESWKASEESDIKASLQQPQELQQKYARASRTSRLLTAEEIARAADLAAVSRRAAGNEEKKRRRPKETALWEKISWDNLYHFPVCPQTQGW